MKPALRNAALTAHVVVSVGWFGSVAAFLALATAGLRAADAEIIRAAYVSMHLITWYVIVPFCLATLLTGILEGAATPWGLFRHYWVVTKLVLTLLATGVLFIHTQPIDRVAAVAARTALASGELRGLRFQLVGDASAALFVLALTAALSVYKPWGMTPYGIRRQLEEFQPGLSTARRARPAGRYVLIGIAAVLTVMVLLHLFGLGMHGH